MYFFVSENKKVEDSGNFIYGNIKKKIVGIWL